MDQTRAGIPPELSKQIGDIERKLISLYEYAIGATFNETTPAKRNQLVGAILRQMLRHPLFRWGEVKPEPFHWQPAPGVSVPPEVASRVGD